MNNISEESKEIGTFTINNKRKTYFKVKIVAGNISVNKAEILQPSCNISNPRTINYKQFEVVYELYESYINKEKGIRAMMSLKNNNTTYIISIIHAYKV